MIKVGEMMNFIKKNKILIIIICIVILIVIGLILFFNNNSKQEPEINDYNYNNTPRELTNTTVYSNDTLSSSHCLNGICISKATFYYTDSVGRVEYTITNTSNKVKSGYLKMVFNEQSLIVSYKNLKPNESIISKSQYMGMEIKNKDDYKLEKLSDDEISQIIK